MLLPWLASRGRLAWVLVTFVHQWSKQGGKPPSAPSAHLPLVCRNYPQKPDPVTPCSKDVHGSPSPWNKDKLAYTISVILFHHYLKQPVSWLNQTQLQAPVFPTIPMSPITSCTGKELCLLLDTERHTGIFHPRAVQVRICCIKVGGISALFVFLMKTVLPQ